jgi:CHAT domain-containing protein/Flp pilus assembly protein TadD
MSSEAKQPTTQQQERLEERDRYGEKAKKLRSEGKLKESIAAVEEMLAIERGVYGDEHEDVAGSLELLADMHEELEAWDAARQARQKVLNVVAILFGEEDYRVTNARLALANLERVARLTKKQRQQLAEVDELGDQVVELYGQGKQKSAIPLARQVMAIRKDLLGDEHPDYAASLHNLGALYHFMGEYADAEPLYVQARDIWKRVVGEEHPSFAASLNSLAVLYRAMGEYAKAEPLYVQALEIRKRVLGEYHPDYALSVNNLAVLYNAMGEHAKAERLYLQALEFRERVLGEEHRDYAASLDNLAGLYKSTGDYDKAELLYGRSREIRKRAVGEEHPDYAATLNNLASLYKLTGEYDKAEPLYVQAWQIRTRVLGEEHPTAASSLIHLAGLYEYMGEYAKAEPLYVQAREIRKRVLGEEHPHYAGSLNGLAGLYKSTGEYAKAEPLHLEALEIHKRVLGEEHPQYAGSLDNLAGLYYFTGEYAKAEPLFLQARDIYKRVLGDEHPRFASTLNNLAVLYWSMGEHDKAEALYAQTLDIRKRVVGEEHPEYAGTLNDLAFVYRSTGKYDEAESLYVQALLTRKRVLGEEHPDYAWSLDNLAGLYFLSGQYAKAEPLVRKALSAKVEFARNLLPWLPEARAMSFVLERQLGRDPLLSVLRKLPITDHRETYSALWQTRALVTRTLSQRRQSLHGSAQAQTVYDRLRIVGQQLAQLTLAVPKSGARERRQRRLADLNEEKEALEKELSKLSIEYQRTMHIRDADAADLAKALPDATAVVDIIRAHVWRRPPKGKSNLESEAHYEAFVMRPTERGADYSVAWVHLGPAEPIEDAIAQWCEAIRSRNDRGFGAARPLPGEPGIRAKQQPSLGKRLRQLIWDKLEPHLDSIQTVIIIPDGELTRLPWAALPGGRPDTFLLEEYAIALADNGQQLYARLTDPGILGDGLLLVGGVSYDKSPTAPSGPERLRASIDRGGPQRTRGPMLEQRPSWAYLSGSEREVADVRDLWPSASKVVLQGTSASETALRQFMPQSRCVHLATHGFFADEKFRSMFGHDVAGEQLFGSGMERVNASRAGVTVRNPLILSGVVLSGANLPPKTDELGLPTGEDGILTAEEVVNLDLRNTELVVLSACDTGLGKVAGGEGVFGLQRAFALAGVRTTIASLWKVDDDATRALMVEFYRNLWEKKLGKLESLRQAQLTMLGQYDPKTKRLRGPGPVRPIDPQRLEEPEGKPREPLPPLYWAGFVLSGDWR